MRLLPIAFLVLISCGQLDKGTEDKVDNILTSASFEFFTYQTNCLFPDMTKLSKDNRGNLVFTTEIDTAIIATNRFNNDIEQEIRQIIRKGYSNNIPGDTGPGNLNRYYWIYSTTDTLRFFNNDKDLFAKFLRIGSQNIAEEPFRSL
jgi:hypothetical protein